MLLSQLEAVVETARQRNLSRAAAVLHVTQPALTARLHALEAELGMHLFTRGRRGMALTDAGRAFLPYAERALAAVDDGAAMLVELKRGGTGELVLGAAPAISTYVLPRLLVRFTERHPRVRLSVRTGHSEEVMDMVLRREVDLGLVRELRHPDIESHPLYDDELVLVAEANHPLAAHSVVEPAAMASVRLILRAAGAAASGVMELDNIDAAKQMVGQGLGIALLPRTAVADELADGRLRAITIRGAQPIRRRIVAIRRRDVGLVAGPTAAFLEILAGVGELLPGARPR
jgi:DNA-binding transcriptional LysR family regulator